MAKLKQTEEEQYAQGLAGQVMRGWRDLEDFLQRMPEKVRKKLLADKDVKELVNCQRAAARLCVPENMQVPEDEV